MKPLQTAAAAASCLLLYAGAAPAVAEDGGLYVGASGGITLSTYSQSELNKSLIEGFNNDFVVKSSTADKPSAVWWAGIGYMLGPNFGIELSYLDLGTIKYRATGTYQTDTATTAAVDIHSRGPALALRGVLPVLNAWSLDARAGLYVGKTTSDYDSLVGTQSNVGSESTTAGSVLLGVGSSYNFTGHLAVRLDVLYINGIHERVLNNSFNTTLLTAGVTYAF
jgi:opacity protein-like surface antigen